MNIYQRKFAWWNKINPNCYVLHNKHYFTFVKRNQRYPTSFLLWFKYSNWRTMILLCLIIYWADNILFTHFKSNYWVSQMRNKLLVYLLNFKVFEEYCTIDQILYDAETFYIIFNDTNCLGKQRICLLCLAHYLDYKDWKFIVKSTLVCGKYINI